MLYVPQVSQWGIGANLTNPDCGCACLLMLLEWYGKRGNLTVDDLARETALIFGSDGLGPDQLITLGMKHRLYLYRHQPTSLSDIRAEIDAGRPVVCLGAYRFLPQPTDHDTVPGNDGHWVVAEGYDDTHIVCDDPDVWQPYVERGHNIPYFDGNFGEFLFATGSICLFVRENQPMSDNEELDATLVRIDQEVSQARTILARIPKPVPGGTGTGTPVDYIVNAPVNVRNQPTTAGTKVGSGLKVGDAVTILEHVAVADGNTWAKITAVGIGVDPAFVGNYVAQGFLTKKA